MQVAVSCSNLRNFRSPMSPCGFSSSSWNGPPGSEPVLCSDNLWGWFRVTFPLPIKNFFFTLQFWWFAIAAVSYVYLNPLFGDNFKQAATFEADWISAILLRNLGLTVVYYEFWHHTLYRMKLSDRKFKPSWPTTAVVMRNRFWTCMGAVQWSAWEIMYAHMFATGRLPFLSDDAITANWGNTARFVLWSLFTPIYRQVHFYFIHRLLHIRPLYKYVHSLHHKNTDPEPWSGLCMHPIEHLFYYSCTALPLLFLQHPFHVFYNGQHAMLSPAEAHSGFEDHNGADLMHYIHHAKFECNYGDGSFVMDKIFGTFRESLEKPAKVIRDDGIGYEAFDDDVAMQATARSGIKLNRRKQQASPSPAPENAAETQKKKKPMSGVALSATIQASIYYLFTASICALLVGVTLDTRNLRNLASIAGHDYTSVVPCIVAFGPLAFGVILLKLFGDKNSLYWPFHKESPTAFLLHSTVGVAIGVLPVYAVLVVFLKDPGYSGVAALTGGLVA